MPKRNYKRGIVAVVAQIKKIIDANPANGKSTATLATEHGISRNALQEVFKEKYHQPIGQYKLQLRMEEARQLLKAGKSIKEVAFILNYASPSSFSNAFSNFYNISASEWLQDGGYNANKQG
ncbi:helix-turn-helix domain-containing protein [Niastella caeni]|nr:AraC family transcriptional regulator [Niastella caeni]